MLVYLDGDYRCHIENEDGSYYKWEDTDGFFSNKCRAFIEGYRVVPEGETWTREDGTVFTGEMISPAVDIAPLLAVQAVYEELRPRVEELTAVIEAREQRIASLEAVQGAMLGVAEGEDKLEAAERFALRIDNAERVADLVTGEMVRG